jgi:hypothetical protein
LGGTAIKNPGVGEIRGKVAEDSNEGKRAYDEAQASSDDHWSVSH